MINVYSLIRGFGVSVRLAWPMRAVDFDGGQRRFVHIDGLERAAVLAMSSLRRLHGGACEGLEPAPCTPRRCARISLLVPGT